MDIWSQSVDGKLGAEGIFIELKESVKMRRDLFDPGVHLGRVGCSQY